MRPIDADALKARINTVFFSEIGQIIDEAPTVNGWIPVSEKLPKDSNMVLVTRYGYIELGKYENGEWFFGLDSLWLKTYGIVAWMPLPEPYRKDDKE